MINTFEPYWTWTKPHMKCNDWFCSGLCWNNYLQIHFTLLGYGFRAGIKLFDVLKLNNGGVPR